MSKSHFQISVDERIATFSDFVKTLDISEKKRALWVEIYANALQDRDNANSMYVSLSQHVVTEPDKHAIHGPNIAKYIERMSKANDQLLKLAELVASAYEVSEGGEELSVDEIYSRMGKDDNRTFSKR